MWKPRASGERTLLAVLNRKGAGLETGLDYFLARYYSSGQGRFTSPDEFKGGAYEFWLLGDPSASEKQALPFGDIRVPQSLNKYQYCYNNPLKLLTQKGMTRGGTKLKPEQIPEANDNKSTKHCSTENGVTKCK